ncbi:heat shock protein Hsp20 [Desulfofarcimen acetoxidans DSM 771]|jgi:HSP20 family molecular chaperone IbpA|uniref:Heat shock protein Hsp20 n=1 Tax=Desulfofarcimen acetoxidans (strain ATCC 49208 / DSM 771 / KCTC 5769 / VKM B-1644 / 5575) TaxID=485916 RepID=C8W4M9_DESAS|nr:Hsp20/alpha crystallin family protein [Desulfofarcimen acetoxidans]ACV63915.1 heat shock protein Hsp20 [Desulfofarcimen acetoxidans DSM 771]
MYISSMNPNQVFATNSNLCQSGVTAFPVSARNTLSGNCVSYSFNPMLNQASAWGLINPVVGQQAWAQGFIPNSGVSSFNNPAIWNSMAYNPYIAQQQAIAQQAFASSFGNQIGGQVFATGLNTIQSSQGMAQMRLDLHETNSDVVVAAELPNVSLNDLNLTVTDDSMSISATALAGGQVTSLFRTVALPTDIKAELVEATYSNGILEIRAPKSDITSRRRLKINVAQ